MGEFGFAHLLVVVKPLSICIVFCSLSSATHNTILMDFSVESLHEMEKEIESEILKLMKAVNISSSSEINQSSLQRLNEGLSQTFLVNVVSSYDENISLCKSAAATRDQLKTEQIELLKRLINAQNDQITSVQKTVRTEWKAGQM